MTEGVAEIRFAPRDGVTRLTHLYQRDPLRVLFPAPAEDDSPLAVIVTTSGGLVAGDRLVMPELAATLELLAEQGAAAFYGGELGRRVSEHVKAEGEGPGESNP